MLLKYTTPIDARDCRLVILNKWKGVVFYGPIRKSGLTALNDKPASLPKDAVSFKVAYIDSDPNYFPSSCFCTH